MSAAPLQDNSTCRDASRELISRKSELCEATVALHYKRVPELATRYSARGRSYCLADCGYHIDYLSQAVSAGEPALFVDYVGWARAMLAAYKVPANDLAVNLECLAEVVGKTLPAQSGDCIEPTIRAALEMLRAELPQSISLISTVSPFAELANHYLQLLLQGKRQQAAGSILQAVDNGTSVRDIYLHVFQPAQQEIGRLWQLNQISVAQEHYCTAATQLIMSQLYPRIFSSPRNGRTVVTACVSGELHELGVRMVSDFFEMDGWDSFYLGANTPAHTIVSILRERNADLLALSTTITTHIAHVSDIIGRVREASLPRLKILVGGYPFNLAPNLYKTVGADGWAGNAEDAVEQANRLVVDA